MWSVRVVLDVMLGGGCVVRDELEVVCGTGPNRDFGTAGPRSTPTGWDAAPWVPRSPACGVAAVGAWSDLYGSVPNSSMSNRQEASGFVEMRGRADKFPSAGSDGAVAAGGSAPAPRRPGARNFTDSSPNTPEVTTGVG